MTTGPDLPPGYPHPDQQTKKSRLGQKLLAAGLLVLAAVAAALAVRYGPAVREWAFSRIDQPPSSIREEPPYAELPGGEHMTATWDEAAGTWVLSAGCGPRVRVRVNCHISATDADAHFGVREFVARVTDGRGNACDGPGQSTSHDLRHEAADGTIQGTSILAPRMGDGGSIIAMQIRVLPAFGGEPAVLAERTVRIVYAE